MNIEDILLNKVLKIKVLHSTPGEMRVHVPILKKAPEKWQIDSGLLSLEKLFDGINEVTFSYETGNAAIKYDPSKIGEDEILELYNNPFEWSLCSI